MVRLAAAASNPPALSCIQVSSVAIIPRFSLCIPYVAKPARKQREEAGCCIHQDIMTLPSSIAIFSLPCFTYSNRVKQQFQIIATARHHKMSVFKICPWKIKSWVNYFLHTSTFYSNFTCNYIFPGSTQFFQYTFQKHYLIPNTHVSFFFSYNWYWKLKTFLWNINSFK